LAEALSFVVAVILNAREELLLLRRASTAQRDPDKWGLSGGRLETGEEPEAAMSRELAEELGTGVELKLEARLGPLPAIGAHGGMVHLFRFTLISGELKLNHEHTGFRWLDRQAFAALSEEEIMPGVTADLTYFGIWPGRSGSHA
jgi:8-oxo-dGTP diphosphatase